MKWAIWAIGAIIAIGAIVVTTGMLLPKAHVASVTAKYKTSPDKLFNAITDVANGPKWRTGLTRVEILGQNPLKWREEASWGKLTMVMDESTSPSKAVSRIADTSQGFGGTWTYDIKPDGTGSVVTIAENGEVYNPLFRFMSKFVFGHYKSLETYHNDLAKHFGEAVTTERVR
ncbi:MAG TPA: SRPBCC family protein [Longimicrobiales bacterium]|nr:SRPBCC family protein [Longimicrobiales bacterium]